MLPQISITLVQELLRVKFVDTLKLFGAFETTNSKAFMKNVIKPEKYFI
jgi:hypothetical protein